MDFGSAAYAKQPRLHTSQFLSMPPSPGMNTYLDIHPKYKWFPWFIIDKKPNSTRVQSYCKNSSIKASRMSSPAF